MLWKTWTHMKAVCEKEVEIERYTNLNDKSKFKREKQSSQKMMSFANWVMERFLANWREKHERFWSFPMYYICVSASSVVCRLCIIALRCMYFVRACQEKRENEWSV